ncbi:MAG: PEP-CTERM sorting domain-containing protein [Burkholderiales bacterium]|nr:PEP-CTERM sorting domain-containing protein [Burkholderiales bacterium]
MTASKMSLQLWTWATAVAMSLPAAAWASSNVLSNGSFETGDLSGWVTEGAATVVDTVASDGHYAVQLGVSDAITAQWATGLAVSAITDLSFDIQHVGGPLNSVWFSYSDGSSSNSIVDGLFESDGWLHYNLVSELAAGKTLTSFTLYGSSPEATYVDKVNVSVQAAAVPEPGSLVLLASGLGVLGLGLTRRRTHTA